MLDSFIEENSGYYDENFHQALSTKISALMEFIQEEKQLSDQTYVQGSPFWLRCYEEIEQSEANKDFMLLETLQEVLVTGSRFSKTIYGGTLILAKGMLDEDFYLQCSIYHIVGPVKILYEKHNDHYIFKQIIEI